MHTCHLHFVLTLNFNIKNESTRYRGQIDTQTQFSKDNDSHKKTQTFKGLENDINIQKSKENTDLKIQMYMIRNNRIPH